jgi:hypothetical protein
MIDQLYPATVAAAQEALKIDRIYQKIRAALLESDLLPAFKKLGLQFLVVDDLVCADLHGFRARLRHDHVWLKEGLTIPRLGGRLRFVLVVAEAKDGDELFQVVFDHLGNARVRTDSAYFLSVSGDPGELNLVVSTICLNLANAVHAKMEVIE